MEQIARAVIFVKDQKQSSLYSIRREKEGKLYFTFPGGHIEKGESPEQAVIREVKEELGIDIEITEALGHFFFEDIQREEYFFYGKYIAGEVGSGTGEEWQNTEERYGTYEIVEIPITDLRKYPIEPKVVEELLLEEVKEK